MKAESIVKELKYRKIIELIKKENFIDLDNYFKYSGKLEVGNKFKRVTEEYTYKLSYYIKNDMNKYKLKNYRK
tara:strand:+ start:297 stop:515 length:219 start_codon:yes stop_codon:yes gene_type:complete